jgi:DNA-binding Lrp family transcriptional regulator
MLIDNTRVPFTDIAKKLLISGTVHVRVKKMEDAGIMGSSLTLDYEKWVILHCICWGVLK